MENLEEIIFELNKKGFQKQAVLLQCNTGQKYLELLIDPFWEKEIKNKLGDNLYDKLVQIKNNQINETSEEIKLSRPLSFINESDFCNYQFNELSIKIASPKKFDEKKLEKCSFLSKKIIDYSTQAMKLIYKEVQQEVLKDNNLILKIYDGFNPGIGSQLTGTPELNNGENNQEGYEKSFKHFLDLFIRANNFGENENNFFMEYLKFKEMYRKKDCILTISLDHGSLTEYEGSNDQLIKEAKKLISNQELFNQGYDRWKKHIEKNLEPILSNHLNREIESALDSNEFERNYYELATIENMIENLYPGIDHNEEHEQLFSLEHPKIILKFLHSPIIDRVKFVDQFDHEITGHYNQLQGLQQIIEGGQVNNPVLSPESVFQNHIMIPNINYSDETIGKLKKIVSRYKSALDSIPDISDLSASSKLRRKKDFTYIMQELSKNPLDVNFGNESGCCIFVPNKKDNLGNGSSVPYYLNEKHIKLFSISYQKSKNKKQRMGLVLAFETEDKQGKKILSCNSLELSRMGICGGKKTIKEISQYVERELKSYAMNNGYSGITMGAHSFNTATNHSENTNSLVIEDLIFQGKNEPFYCEVLDFHNDEPRKIRKNNSYWIWRNKNV